jgi:hypothetical protein
MEKDKIQWLSTVYDNRIMMHKKYIAEFKPDFHYERGAYGLLFDNENFALYKWFVEKDLKAVKQHYFNIGRVIAFLVKKTDSEILNYGLAHITSCLLSDQLSLGKACADLKHNNFLGRSYMESVNRGDSTGTYVFQCLLKEDWAEYERVMPIYKNKFLKKNKLMEIDYAFYEALIARDKVGMESALQILVSPKMHKRRNIMPLVNDFVSHPAVGYAKLAWLKGIEVEVDSPLVPKEWLPVQPLKEEEYVDYDFVKAYLG